MSSEVEWAVIRRRKFRGIVDVVKGGLGSRVEAEAWCEALRLSQERHGDRLMLEQDAILTWPSPEVAFREVGPWVRIEEESPPCGPPGSIVS